MMMRLATGLFLACFTFHVASAQTREELVREDKRKVTEGGFWIYNDLDKAFAQAKQTGKPILVVLRCIPCHECVKLDDDLVDKDPVIRPLLDQFVCARQVSTNGLDLSLFQYDTDQSFAVFMLNADGTIYGRFGTRSHRTESFGDVSLEGLAAALKGALELHSDFPSNKNSLVGKRGGKPEVASPELYPALKDKFTDSLNYDGDVVKSCIHCHQIGDAQREFYWNHDKEIPENIIFPYPHPKTLGLILDPETRATVKSVDGDSIAQRTGLRAGDTIVAINGQPPLSIADVQWVLQQTPAVGGDLLLEIERDGNRQSLTMSLSAGWRRAGDLSWRVTSWGYRRMVTGGLLLGELEPERREKLNLPESAMALKVKHLGQYGAHAAAKRAGFRKDDVLVEFDGRSDLTTESKLFHHALTHHRPGQKVAATVLRGGKRLTMELPIQR